MPCPLPIYPLPFTHRVCRREWQLPPCCGHRRRAAPGSILQSVVREPLQDSQGDEGLLINKIAPDYPPLALQARIRDNNPKC